MKKEINIRTENVDYKNPQQAKYLVDILNTYAVDPMGGGQDLLPEVRQNLASELTIRRTIL